MTSKSYRESLINRLIDPEYAEGYIRLAYEEYFEDHNLDVLGDAIDDVLLAGNKDIVLKVVKSLVESTNRTQEKGAVISAKIKSTLLESMPITLDKLTTGS